jgi:3'(2'), 5'-bisphosphate nucleotidase
LFDPTARAELVNALTEIAARAAAAVLQASADAPRRKADGSPVTAADEASEAVICKALEELFPGISIISEERSPHSSLGAASLKNGTYFLVDPLDGTREFIGGRDEYTVNIALMSDGAPILGVVTAPAMGTTWRGIVGRGADRVSLAGSKAALPMETRVPPPSPLILVSRSHLDSRTKSYLEAYPDSTLSACGSSIKFCRIAEGSADLYPRLAPTHDWDVAAGHAVLIAAGGDVRAADGMPLVYGTPDRIIPDFVARGRSSFG